MSIRVRDSQRGGGAPASPLDSLSLSQVKGTTLPRGQLVYLEQTAGPDPFNWFQRGLENDNPLDVNNAGKTLEIKIAGQCYVHGQRDGADVWQITPLEYSRVAQRYWISTTGDPSFELLVNVDRREETARVWMRQPQGGAWTPWKVAVEYG